MSWPVGKKRSEEAKANIRRSKIEFYKNPENRRILSEKMRSEKTRTKLSRIMIERFKNPENRRILSEKMRGRKRSEETKAKMRRNMIERYKNPENRRILGERIRQAILEEPFTSIQPPAIREIEFLSIDTVQIGSIRDYFGPFVRQLHAFLNHLLCLYDIQLFRRNWLRHTYKVAFGNFVVEPRHWYTYNHGGRNESQFNLGLCKDYFRIGLGFEFTEASRGDPKIVYETYSSFLKVIQQDLGSFQQFVNRESLEVEYVVKREPIIVNMENAVEWLLNPDKDAIWIFIGRLLMRNQDTSILADPAVLANNIESVFKGFRPIWEKTQLMTKNLDNS